MKPFPRSRLALTLAPVAHGEDPRRLSRKILRRELSRRFGGDEAAWEFGRDDRGRLQLLGERGREISFSVAYTAGFVAVAFARGTRVGVDLEREIPPWSPVTAEENPISAALTESERDYLADCTDDERWGETLRVWTMKEAFGKLVGIGADLDAETVEVVPMPAGVRIRTRIFSAGGTRFRLALATDRRRRA